MSAAEALAGWLLVNAWLATVATVALLLWCQYERQGARHRARMADERREQDRIDAQDPEQSIPITRARR